MSEVTERKSFQAKWRLGVLYEHGKSDEHGKGVPKDLKEAIKWYKEAADQGCVEAQYTLGRCYEKGIGVPPDAKQARKWYQDAADQYDSVAQGKYDELDGQNDDNVAKELPADHKNSNSSIGLGGYKQKIQHLLRLYEQHPYPWGPLHLHQQKMFLELYLPDEPDSQKLVPELHKICRDKNIVLLRAASEGNHLLFELALEFGAKINFDFYRDEANRNALQCASKNGHFSMVERILTDNVFIKTKTSEILGGALIHACENGHVEVVERLLKENFSLVDVVDKEGHNALFYAREGGHKDVEHLLRHKIGILRPSPDFVNFLQTLGFVCQLGSNLPANNNPSSTSILPRSQSKENLNEGETGSLTVSPDFQ